ncbi:hypothetical protein [Endozoicomonas euniceicola]|uniref:Uncharacterized protein n=1 Tax=Endozoicomonas euniceicola TaxID=1234143 RepID=A0ABY6GMH8_9GAMM|nr:hypothetical protein [Endozoicomonas euniceicola]UYM13934.1 hypothetical protein NX720_13510 [Endozoicomonas euniceicola]
MKACHHNMGDCTFTLPGFNCVDFAQEVHEKALHYCTGILQAKYKGGSQMVEIGPHCACEPGQQDKGGIHQHPESRRVL